MLECGLFVTAAHHVEVECTKEGFELISCGDVVFDHEHAVS